MNPWIISLRKDEISAILAKHGINNVGIINELRTPSPLHGGKARIIQNLNHRNAVLRQQIRGWYSQATRINIDRSSQANESNPKMGMSF